MAQWEIHALRGLVSMLHSELVALDRRRRPRLLVRAARRAADNALAQFEADRLRALQDPEYRRRQLRGG